MLIFLLFFALLQHLQGAPLVDTESSNAISLRSIDLSSVITHSHIQFGTRTKADIIITCLATIFACTWTAVHPNIPSPTDSGFDIFKRRVRMMFFALLAPEAITTFALRQRLAASEIAEGYNGWAEEYTHKTLRGVTAEHEQRQAKLVPVPTAEGAGLSSAEETAPSDTAYPVSRVESLVRNPTKSGWIREALAKTEKWLLWLATPATDWFRRPTLAPRQEGQIEKWTMTHGFFVQMGGFVLSKNGMPLVTIQDEPRPRYKSRSRQLISYPGIKDLIDENKIHAPIMTEADIQDRSKGDVISKMTVILQTTWFLAQCIARWATGLAVTELEVITLGFVVLNGLTYACWWHKPQNVGVPVYLEWISTVESPPDGPINLTKISYIRKVFQVFIGSGNVKSFTAELFFLLVVPLYPIISLLTGSGTDKSSSLRVSMFYSNNPQGSKGSTLSFTMSVVAVVFGAVHLAPAWSLIFPSHTMMVIWRTCAIVATVVPITVVPLLSISANSAYDLVGDIFLLIISLSYLTSRIALFVLAFISLRHLSSQALTTVEWLSVFPHI